MTDAPTPDPRAVVDAVLDWYQHAARDLPWRRPDATAWGILVSEVMLQQTPVARVVGPWTAWLERWPTPDDLASEPSAAAVAAWGRLGYPRRALRLHAAATAIATRHGGEVPGTLEELRALPGIGEYTAAAVASFAFGQRQVVVDTNVRRVLARVALGQQYPAPSQSAAERSLAASFLPDDASRAARWAVASMELGALVCTARSPRCDECPVRELCRWQQAGRPPHAGPPRKGQDYEGTDRQCRGVLLAAVREGELLSSDDLIALWTKGPREQAERCLASLLTDGLLHHHGDLLGL